MIISLLNQGKKGIYMKIVHFLLTILILDASYTVSSDKQITREVAQRYNYNFAKLENDLPEILQKESGYAIDECTILLEYPVETEIEKNSVAKELCKECCNCCKYTVGTSLLTTIINTIPGVLNGCFRSNLTAYSECEIWHETWKNYLTNLSLLGGATLGFTAYMITKPLPDKKII